MTDLSTSQAVTDARAALKEVLSPSVKGLVVRASDKARLIGGGGGSYFFIDARCPGFGYPEVDIQIQMRGHEASFDLWGWFNGLGVSEAQLGHALDVPVEQVGATVREMAVRGLRLLNETMARF